MSLSTGISFPLLKISLATDPAKAKTINWKHETRDIRVFFDDYGAMATHGTDFPILNIFQGNAVLERVNLATKVREAAAMHENTKQTGNALSGPQDQPLTILYVRHNRTMAICYHLPDSKIRRMQLKFAADVDFDRVLALLESLGCRPLPHGRDRSTTLRNDSRPTSVSNIHERAHAPSFPLEGPGPDNRISSNHFFSVDERPYSSNYVPQLDRPLSHGYQPRNDDWRRPSSGLPLQPIREDQPYHGDPVLANIGGYTQRPRAASIRPETTMSLSTRPWSHGQAAAPVLRPSSMSDVTFAQLQHDLDASIPPRRELRDIERLPSKQSLASRDGHRPISSIELPEFPEASFINPPLVEKSGPAALSRSELDRIADPFGEGPASASTKPNDTAKHAAISSPTRKKPAAAKGTSANERPSTALSASSTILNVSSSTHASSSTRPSSVNKDHVNRINAALPSRAGAATLGSSRSHEKEMLAHYVEMEYEDRMKTLEQMIVNAVDDDNFVRLCEDVGACWQRIGFDKRL